MLSKISKTGLLYFLSNLFSVSVTNSTNQSRLFKDVIPEANFFLGHTVVGILTILFRRTRASLAPIQRNLSTALNRSRMRSGVNTVALWLWLPPPRRRADGHWPTDHWPTSEATAATWHRNITSITSVHHTTVYPGQPAWVGTRTLRNINPIHNPHCPPISHSHKYSQRSLLGLPVYL